MKNQFTNEQCNFKVGSGNDRSRQQIHRLRQKLYDQGKITKTEFEMMQDRNKPLNEIKELASEKERMVKLIDDAWSTDYLDENEQVALKYGCVSIFTPKRIGNLNTICFKIRGLFETTEDLADRIENLKKKYPNDPIQQLEIGKWCVDTDSMSLSDTDRLKQLNYAMKCHIDNMALEAEEFDKRRETMKTDAENHAKLTALNNKKEKRKARRQVKREAKADAKSDTKSDTKVTPSQSIPEHSKSKPVKKSSTTHSLTVADDKNIQRIMDFLHDDELLGKYETELQDKSNATVIDI